MPKTVLGRTILALWLDSNAAVRAGVSRALANTGCQILWAEDVRAALQSLKRRPVDLLLLDLAQPLGMGWPIYERLSRANPQMPIVIITARKTAFEQAIARQAGGLLEKPFRLASLLGLINSLLAKSAKEPVRRVEAGTSSARESA